MNYPRYTIDSIAAHEKAARSIRMTMSLAFPSPTLVQVAIDGGCRAALVLSA